MKCPICGGHTKGLETRTRRDGTLRRRHECGQYHRFTTLQLPGREPVVVAADKAPRPRGAPSHAELRCAP